VVGPSVLGWARVDAPVQVLSGLGLGMLLFLTGLEIDTGRLRGPLARQAGTAFSVSAALALLCALVFWLVGQTGQPLLLAVILMSTWTELMLPLLKDAGEAATELGQMVMTGAGLAEMVPVTLLALFFSAEPAATDNRLVSLAMFLAVLVLIGLGLAGVRRLNGLDQLPGRLEERSGQLRIRATLTLALACGVLAYRFGFAAILGAFAADLLVRLVEMSGREPNQQYLVKLEGIGFGFLIPVFTISSGVAFQLKDLLARPAALAEVPLIVVACSSCAGCPRCCMHAPRASGARQRRWRLGLPDRNGRRIRVRRGRRQRLHGCGGGEHQPRAQHPALRGERAGHHNLHRAPAGEGRPVGSRRRTRGPPAAGVRGQLHRTGLLFTDASLAEHASVRYTVTEGHGAGRRRHPRGRRDGRQIPIRA
jgi:Kef-type K+ transport system membrane component KefB